MDFENAAAAGGGRAPSRALRSDGSYQKWAWTMSLFFLVLAAALMLVMSCETWYQRTTIKTPARNLECHARLRGGRQTPGKKGLWSSSRPYSSFIPSLSSNFLRRWSGCRSQSWRSLPGIPQRGSTKFIGVRSPRRSVDSVDSGLGIKKDSPN
ncbi:hypothetical protein H4582DRAFT_1375 [Lactarius indigo]|nr:hypothetical protein H4582DRAFT_1375 [Lactarius indigo]